MSQEITELDAQTVERIAAGEVVERPASAVKELVENSIDADASRVTVAVEKGGIESIRVTDDGIGMSESAVERAVKEHTTSKIGDIDDLESGVGTLGFRGEALHAIGAVSRLTITTRPRGGDRGTELTVEGGEITDISPAGSPEGTTVEIVDLFYNVPARRKYLKQESTEFDHVNRVVTSYALANPDVAVTLEHNGRETFSTNGTGDLTEAVLAVYGREVAESMIEIQPEDTADLADGPLESITGLVSHPETNRASREYCSTFVNGRYVTANTVRNAVFDAYGGQLASDRYPFAVIFLELDPASVDVNVHPRKLEVRFAAESAVSDQIEETVENALLRAGLLRSSAPRGKSAPGETAVEPESGASERGAETAQSELDGETAGTGSDDSVSTASEAQLDTEQPETDSTVAAPGAERDNPEGGSDTGSNTETVPQRIEGTQIDSGRTPDRSEWSSSSASHSETSPSDESEPTKSAAGQGAVDSSSTNTDDESIPRAQTPDEPDSNLPSGDDGGDQPETDSVPSERKFRGANEQTQLDSGTEPASEQFDSLPSMEILGQLHDTYIVAETSEGMVLIDQHAADERINYERLQEQFAGDVTTQALASPVELELTAREAELFSAHEDALAKLGFHASLAGDRTVEVTTIPALVAEAAGPSLIRDLLTDFVGGDTNPEATVEAAADELLADLACYPSITGNTSLTEGSVIDLLRSLDSCTNPYACPHGRPVIIEFAREELEARFERDYPGHGD